MEERDNPGRPWVIAVAVLVVTVLAATILFYAPLEVGEEARCPEDSEQVPPEETEDGPVEGGELCLVQHEAGQVIIFGTDIRNGGPLPITVTDLAFDSAVRDVLEVTDVRMRWPGDDSADLVPLEPFRMAPGSELYLEVHAALRPCDTLRGGRLITLTHLPVRTRFAVVTKTAHVPLTSQLGVLLGDCAP
jgi:hypothetical protein